MHAYRDHHIALKKAFTLLELILVMIVLCTVLAMAAPTLRGFFSSRQLNDISEHIVSMTRYAKVHSVFEGKPYRLTFDLMQRQYWLSSLSDSQYERLKNNFGNYYPIPKEIEIDFDDVDYDRGLYFLQFSPRGHSKESRIRLQDNQGNILEVVCPGPAENYEVVKIYNNKEYYVE
jgi:prepilin-type N-terminal cleavage/methylation domain-containing protein